MAVTAPRVTKLVPTPEMERIAAELQAVERRLPRYGMGLMWILMFATVIDGFDRSLLSTVLEDVRREFDLSDSDLGLLTGAYSVLATLSVIPFGFLVDRYRRVTILAAGFVPWALGMVGQGLATSFAFFFGCRVLLGLLEASNTPSTNSLLGDYYPVRDRQRIFGLQAIANIAGYAAGPILGGLTAYWWGWQATFVFWGVVGFVTGVIVWRTLPEPPRGLQDAAHRLRTRLQRLRHEQRRAAAMSVPLVVTGDDLSSRRDTDTPPAAPLAASPAEALVVDLSEPAAPQFDYRSLRLVEAIREVLRIKSVWFVYFGVTVTAFSGSLMATWPATFYRRYHGMSVTGAGLITGLNALTALVGIVLATRVGTALVKRGRSGLRVALVSICYAVSGVLWGLAFYTNFAPISLHFLVIGSIFATGPTPLLLALQADLVNPYLRGRAAALTSLLRVVGTTAAPVGLGLLADKLGLRNALIMGTLPIGLIGAAVILPALRTYDTDAAHQQRESVRQARRELAERGELPVEPVPIDADGS